MSLKAQWHDESTKDWSDFYLTLTREYYDPSGVGTEIVKDQSLFQIENNPEFGLFKAAEDYRIIGHGEGYREVKFFPVEEITKKQIKQIKKLPQISLIKV